MRCGESGHNHESAGLPDILIQRGNVARRQHGCKAQAAEFLPVLPTPEYADEIKGTQRYLGNLRYCHVIPASSPAFALFVAPESFGSEDPIQFVV